jgi:hypothetical protein
MCIVLLWDGILCSHLSGPLDLMVSISNSRSCWFFCLDGIAISDRGVKGSHYHCVGRYLWF